MSESNDNRGVWQPMPQEPIDVEEIRRTLDAMTPEERVEAVQNYMKSRYGGAQYELKIPTPQTDEETIDKQLAVYTQMVHRETGGSDPLVQEPGPGKE